MSISAMTKKRDRGDYFKQRRAKLAAERKALEAQAAPAPGAALSETLLVRVSPTMLACIDHARKGGLFQRSRSEWARLVLAEAIDAHVPRDVRERLQSPPKTTT